MRKRIGLFALMGIVIAVIATGCSDIPDSTASEPQTAETTTSEDEVTIFDKIIKGTALDDNDAIFDVTDEYLIDGYSIVTSAIYGNDHLIVVYSGENDSCIYDYVLSDGDSKKSITIKDTVINDNAVLEVFSETLAYVYDKDAKAMYYFNMKKESYDTAALDFTPYNYLILDNGDKILYTLKKDNNIYQYIRGSEYTSSVYEADEELSDLDLVCDEEDGNTIIIKYMLDDNSCFGELSMEEQEINKIDFAADSLYYSDGKFICSSKDKAKTVLVYDKLRPRLVSSFSFEDEDEIEGMCLYGDHPFALTEVNDDSYLLLRFYDIENGIMNNYVSISAEYTVVNTNYIEDRMLLDLNTTDNNQKVRILIWDVEKVSEIIS